MKINEAEQSIGITKKNIRFYEEQGLLKPSRNVSNGYRDYSPEDIEALRRIKLLRKLNIPIEDIRKLQGHYLSLEDCLRRQLIALEHEKQNLESVEKFCHRILQENSSLESLDITQLLSDMENMEEGGMRFLDIQKKDRKLRRKNAYIAAGTTIALLLLSIALIIWAAVVDPVPLGLVLLFILIPLALIAGILLALKERLKEIEGGELDEAAKY